MEAPKFWEPVRSVHLRWAETGPGLAQWRRRTCSLQAGQDRSSFLLSARGRRRDAPTGVCVHADAATRLSLPRLCPRLCNAREKLTARS